MNSTSPDTDPAESGDGPDLDAAMTRMTEAGEQYLEWIEDGCKGIPAGVDGLVHEAPGVLRAISKTFDPGEGRHEYLLTYKLQEMPMGCRYVVLSCTCPCCTLRGTPACRHAAAADTLLNQFIVKAALLAVHAGQVGPCEIVRAWTRQARCYGCGFETLYVHLYRRAEGYACRQHDRKSVCTRCGLWRHES